MAIEPTLPRRVRRDRSRGWRKPANSVIVDRTSRWGNPWAFVVRPETGSWYVCRAKTRERTGRWWPNPSRAQEACVRYFERWLRITPSGRDLAARARKQLVGRDLCCWCGPVDCCHADVLLAVARGEDPPWPFLQLIVTPEDPRTAGLARGAGLRLVRD